MLGVFNFLWAQIQKPSKPVKASPINVINLLLKVLLDLGLSEDAKHITLLLAERKQHLIMPQGVYSEEGVQVHILMCKTQHVWAPCDFHEAQAISGSSMSLRRAWSKHSWLHRSTTTFRSSTPTELPDRRRQKMDHRLLGGGTAGEFPRGNTWTEDFLWGKSTRHMWNIWTNVPGISCEKNFFKIFPAGAEMFQQQM